MLGQWLYRGFLVSSLLSLYAEPLLAQNRIIQQSSSRATATGKNSVAASQVEQFATQNGSRNSPNRKQLSSMDTVAPRLMVRDQKRKTEQQKARRRNKGARAACRKQRTCPHVMRCDTGLTHRW